MKPSKLIIIEDNKEVRENVSKYISFHDQFELVSSFICVEDFLLECDKGELNEVDLMILDIGLPGMSGLEGISFIKEKIPSIEILMLTTYEEEEKILQALTNGASSYISKKASLKEIVGALEIVKKGGSYMSPSIARELINFFSLAPKKSNTTLSLRQKEILDLLVEGDSYAIIGTKLFISVETVRSHIKKMYRFLQVNNKAAAISKYLKGEIK